MFLPNLKICGITTRETARFCAEVGVGALGAVFFRKSPRYVTPQQARAQFEGLPDTVARVGVFVDMPADEVIAAAREARLDTVQMHGSEARSEIEAVQRAGFHVIKVLKVTGDKLLEAAQALPASAGILVECGKGRLPGGNGAVWNWADAAPLADVRPFALAGGLTPDNLADATRLSGAAAWDLSSGVETAPGVKDHAAILKTVQTLTDFLRQPPTPIDSGRFWSPRVASSRALPSQQL
jgi:phosphoribosylanthranilate isomerase